MLAILHALLNVAHDRPKPHEYTHGRLCSRLVLVFLHLAFVVSGCIEFSIISICLRRPNDNCVASGDTMNEDERCQSRHCQNPFQHHRHYHRYPYPFIPTTGGSFCSISSDRRRRRRQRFATTRVGAFLLLVFFLSWAPPPVQCRHLPNGLGVVTITSGVFRSWPTDSSWPKRTTRRNVPPIDLRGGGGEVDIGSLLSQSYCVQATRSVGASPVLGGSLNDALRLARSQSRLLIVLIPSCRPEKGVTVDDIEALRSFLSAEVASVAERSARKKHKGGSFLLWCATAGSPEAIGATKRLKAQQVGKGQQKPILLVAYPAQALDGRGQSTIVVPRILAQHHCRPPPSPETMAAWLNAIRKRHAKQYINLQTAAQEAHYFQERTAGYQGSIQSDRDRAALERAQAAELVAQERAERDHDAALQRRRVIRRAALAPEPERDEADVKTVSLRWPDGRSSQRRFSADVELTELFYWADVEFEVDGEALRLTTMNGKQSFTWDDRTVSLADAGLGKMTGMRVTQTKQADTRSATPPS
jgi:hypothetical protein